MIKKIVISFVMFSFAFTANANALNESNAFFKKPSFDPVPGYFGINVGQSTNNTTFISVSKMKCNTFFIDSLTSCNGLYIVSEEQSIDPLRIHLVFEISTNTNPVVFTSMGVDPFGPGYEIIVDPLNPNWKVDIGHVGRLEYGVKYNFKNYTLGVSRVQEVGILPLLSFDGYQLSIYFPINPKN